MTAPPRGDKQKLIVSNLAQPGAGQDLRPQKRIDPRARACHALFAQGTLTPLEVWPIFCEYPERCSGLSPFAPLALPIPKCMTASSQPGRRRSRRRGPLWFAVGLSSSRIRRLARTADLLPVAVAAERLVEEEILLISIFKLEVECLGARHIPKKGPAGDVH